MEKVERGLERFDNYLINANLDRKQYQCDGLKWCLINELRNDPIHNIRGGFIADEMGLGKTILMIGLMYANFVPRTLIVLPPVLIDQWTTQIYKTTGHKPLVYYGANKKLITREQFDTACIVITSYNTLALPYHTRDNVERIRWVNNTQWNRVIFDEAHHIRNLNTKNGQSAYDLKSNIRWLVSGTPIQNKIEDFYSLCFLLRMPATFYKNTDNHPTLKEHFILKRTKKEVGIKIQTVNLNETIVDWSAEDEMLLSKQLHSILRFSNIDNCNQSKENTEIINQIKPLGTLALMIKTRQSCIYPKLIEKHFKKMVNNGIIDDYSCYQNALEHSSKLDTVVNEIAKRKENSAGKLVFCHFHEEMDYLEARLKDKGFQRVVKFDGRTKHTDRKTMLNEKNEVMLIQIQSGCEGLNLQDNYSEIYFTSPHWNPTIEDQAIARCHRIGQSKPVDVIRFKMNSFIPNTEKEQPNITIEKYIHYVQENKRDIASKMF